MNTKKIHYSEGQWFAIPLKKGGYAIGIITEKSNRSKNVWENNLTKDDALDYFNRIAEPNSVTSHKNPFRRSEGALEGTIKGIHDSYVAFRPISSSKPKAPTIDIHRAPGLRKYIEIKFLGGVIRH